MKKLFLILLASICLTGCNKTNSVDTKATITQKFEQERQQFEKQSIEIIDNGDGTYLIIQYAIRNDKEIDISYYWCEKVDGTWKIREVRKIN